LFERKENEYHKNKACAKRLGGEEMMSQVFVCERCVPEGTPPCYFSFNPNESGCKIEPPQRCAFDGEEVVWREIKTPPN
jgi:hypothetical protein